MLEISPGAVQASWWVGLEPAHWWVQLGLVPLVGRAVSQGMFRGSCWLRITLGSVKLIGRSHHFGRNINNLRYADDTTLMAESEEELKSLLMKVKEKLGKVCLFSQIIPPSPSPIESKK